MSPAPEMMDVEALEVELLLEAVFRRYGFDFRDYAYPSIKRRIQNQVRAERLHNISELQGKLLSDRSAMERFLHAVTVNVTAMYRDPAFYRAFRTRVVPLLQPLPFVRSWHVGCSTGEEVYSMAVLLREEGLHPRCRIYATDLNEHVLADARAGIFPLDLVKTYTRNYLDAAGRNSFSEYYTAKYDRVIFHRALVENVVFAQHNLATDGSFNEFHTILCRNVMIFFNDRLAARVHKLLYESLSLGGFLCLGARESIQFSPHEACYEEFDKDHSVYRKIK